MNDSNPYQEKKTTVACSGAVIVLVGLVVSFLLFVKPNDDETVYLFFSETRLPGKCISRGYFGFDCPGCGLTRSIVCISHGQWRRAADFNVGGFVIYFGAVLFLIYTIGSHWLSPSHVLHGHRFWTNLIWILLVLLIVQWLVKQWV